MRLARELAQHGGQLSRAELARRSGLAKRSVELGLSALQSGGVVSAAGFGRSVLYSLRAGHPLAAALVSLFAAEEARYQSILDSIRDAAARPGILAAWLFGSVARGEDRTGSDLDLALVAAAEALPDVADAVRDALVEPSVRLGFSPAVTALAPDDVLRLAAGPDPWWVTVERDAVALNGRRPGEMAAWLLRRTAAA